MSSPSKNAGYDFYENVLGSPKYIVAPMVEQSELAFRAMCRKYGAQLCYTPMWHAGIFTKDEKYRKAALETCPTDRPLLFQFCANDPEKFATACELAAPYCDGIDLNLGCPQAIAARGHYGAFLMEEIDLIENIIKAACARVDKPITAKIRRFETIEETVQYAKRLEQAGAKIITVHGRLRLQRGPKTGLADWEHIKAVKENVSVPVFGNGNIQYLSDVERCLQYTKVDGVMIAEGALTNPALFSGTQPPAWEMVDEYLSFVQQHSTTLGTIRGHLFRILIHCLKQYPDLRNPLGSAKKLDKMVAVFEQIKALCVKDAEQDVQQGKDSQVPGSLPYWRCKPYVRPPPVIQPPSKRSNDEENPPSKRKLLQQKHEQNGGKGLFRKLARDKWPICITCKCNPWGTKCEYKRCRKCCKEISAVELLNCRVHKCRFKTNHEANQKVNDEVDSKTEFKDIQNDIEIDKNVEINITEGNMADKSELKNDISVKDDITVIMMS